MNKLALCSALLLCSVFAHAEDSINFTGHVTANSPGAADPIYFDGPAATDTVDFSGHWTTDSGELTDTKGTKFHCTKIEMTLKQTAGSLTIEHYAAVCESVKPDWGPSSMTIKDGKTYETDPDTGEQHETGTLKGNTLLTDSLDNGTDYAFNLRLTPAATGQPAVLESYYGVKNYAGAMVIEGKLKPAP